MNQIYYANQCMLHIIIANQSNPKAKATEVSKSPSSSSALRPQFTLIHSSISSTKKKNNFLQIRYTRK